MSYHSVHSTLPFRYAKQVPITVSLLSHMTWAELRKPGSWLTGNTKWQEVECIIFFFKNGFINTDTSRDIGYSTITTKMGGGGASALYRRLDKVNTKELLSLITKAKISGLLKRDWAWILDPTRGASATKSRKRYYSKHRIIFSKAIVNQAIHKYGLNKVCFKLRVDMRVISFWRDYEV